MKKRILKSEKILTTLFAKNDAFYVGLPFEEVVANVNRSKYGLSANFTEGISMLPNPKGSTTKQNLKGKFIRKMPEEKTTRTVHISYRRKDGYHIEFDRDFHVYVRVLTHKFEIKFTCVTNKHGQKLLISPILKYEDTHDSNTKSTHIINLFLEIFGDYELFTSELEPAIAFTDRYDFDVLPKGTIEDDDIEYFVEGARRFLKKDEEVQAFQKRLNIIKEYNPEIVGKGPNGFFGYIVFGFKELGVVILESMYLGNATYVFDIINYENLIVKNKQEVLNNKLSKKRFLHYDNWETSIRNFLSLKKAA